MVLSRKPGETIVIGTQGEIQVMIVSVKGDRVRIGIDAPSNVPVHRAEVWVRKHEEKEQRS